MSTTGLVLFDKTIQMTHAWLGEIEQTLGPDRRLAWKALSAVLQVLRDRLPVELAAHLGAQLPLIVRGTFYDQFEPARQPRGYDLDEFIEQVAERMERSRPVDAFEATRAVLATLSRHIPNGQIAKLQRALPGDIRRAWQAVEERIVPPPDVAPVRGNGSTVRLEIEDEIRIDGRSAILAIPRDAAGIVIFAHGSGSGRHSPRNRFVARELQEANLATLLLDLLNEAEERDRANVFDMDLLAARLKRATQWVHDLPRTGRLPVGYFGASTGAGAALLAAADPATRIAAIVSRGGRADLAGPALARVRAPTLLIVGGLDAPVLRLNEEAYEQLGGEKDLQVVAGASHVFEEPGKLEEVAQLAADWFKQHLRAPRMKERPNAAQPSVH
jgi:putative phosphoribosyl transferase